MPIVAFLNSQEREIFNSLAQYCNPAPRGGVGKQALTIRVTPATSSSFVRVLKDEDGAVVLVTAEDCLFFWEKCLRQSHRQLGTAWHVKGLQDLADVFGQN